MLTILTGGTGGAKLIEGLAAESDPAELTIICNTADDAVFHGLHVSPDLDTITYTLAGISDSAKGWGIQDESFAVLEQLRRLGEPTWFKLGDKDLATHIIRSRLLNEGVQLARITGELCHRLGVSAKILPMSDERVETRLCTPEGEITFQEYFVRERWSKPVISIRFEGAERSQPAPGVIEAIGQASAVVICPSNPVTSIGPILAVPGIRAALTKTQATVVALSPIVGVSAISGPAHKLMAAAGFEPSPFGVAQAYADFLDIFVIATADERMKSRIESLGITTVLTDILMSDRAGKRRVAREVLALLEK
ncbi:MAG: 2-phospho-L-lactate transferase [Deltaproteobacteria bacterium]